MKDAGLDSLLGGLQEYETLSFYNGSVTLHYSDALHAYFRDDGTHHILVPGVTSVLGIIEKPALVQWSSNMTVQWILQNIPCEDRDALLSLYELAKNKQPLPDDAHLVALPQRDLVQLLNKARFNYREISKDACDVGHQAHEWLEGLLNAMIRDDSAWADYVVAKPNWPEDERAQRCINAALEWMQKHKFRPTHSEQKIYSLEYDYSGTLDFLGYITGCGDPKCCPFHGEVRMLGDFKSSNSIYEEYRAQLASYRNAWEEEHPEDVIGVCVVLRLGKNDGEFDSLTVTEEDFEDDLDGFLGALKTYSWLKGMDLKERAVRAEDKAEKKRLREQAKAVKAAGAKVRKRGKKVNVPAVFFPAEGGIPIEEEVAA